jgi:hypothetical protein
MFGCQTSNSPASPRSTVIQTRLVVLSIAEV